MPEPDIANEAIAIRTGNSVLAHRNKIAGDVINDRIRKKEFLMPQNWETRWKEHPARQPRKGGNSSITPVLSLADSTEGALKVLDAKQAKLRERRFRVRQEADALRALSRGVPKLLDTNAMDDDEQLFIVMEWIDGPTLADHVSRGPMSMDDSLKCIEQILHTLTAMHELPMVHRDLKPDNVILRNGNPATPIVVDLGLAWTSERSGYEFHTEEGQEIGNRFLRLPEFAPGRPSQDHRSDLTLAAGLLFFMLTGASPRVLIDEHGRSPHDPLARKVPPEVESDARWTRVSRVLTRAFQIDLALRYQSANEMLQSLTYSPTNPAEDPLSPALERLKARMESQSWQQKHALQKEISNFGARVDQQLRKLFQASGLSLPGGHGFDNKAQRYTSNIGLQIPGVSGGTVCTMYHVVLVEGARVSAHYGIHGVATHSPYYQGSVAGILELEEAFLAKAPEMIAEALAAFERLTT